ncbi:MAG: type II secretion system protein [bacterium]|nr:type II secretion system protein [bacterium]
MIGNNKKQGWAGFTLVEVLVSLAVFSVIATIATDLSLSFYRTQRKTENMEELSFAARSIMERLVQEIRESEIDYQAYGEGTVGLSENTLYLSDSENQPIIFRKFNINEGCPEQDASCLKISNNGTNWSSLTPKGVNLNDLRFYIMPLQNPFVFNQETLTYQAQEQPYVTILLSLERTKPGFLGHKEKVSVQTSVSSRIYKR